MNKNLFVFFSITAIETWFWYVFRILLNWKKKKNNNNNVKNENVQWQKVYRGKKCGNNIRDVQKSSLKYRKNYRLLSRRSFERFISIFASRVYLAARVVNYSNELLFSNAMIRERWDE